MLGLLLCFWWNAGKFWGVCLASVKFCNLGQQQQCFVGETGGFLA